MTELFPPSLAEQIACVDREIALRQRVYPRWVSNGRMNQAKATREIETMTAVRNTLVRAKEINDAKPGGSTA